MGQRSVLFDLDGTLTDSRPGITRCIQFAMTAMGHVPPEEEALHWCLGPPLKTSFSRLLGTNDQAVVDTAIQRYRERFSVTGMFENTLYEGIPELLAQLSGRGYRLYVATSKPRVFAQRILEHFGIAVCFQGIHGSELDGTRADKAELIAHLLESEGLDPADVIMVGDREHDMLGGAACGVRGLGVTYGYGSETELITHGASGLAHHPREIAAAVEVLFGKHTGAH